MGKLLTIETTELLPSQDFLKEGTVRFILKCLLEGNLDELPPSPIVRHHPSKEAYVAIDGHNIIAVRDFRGENIEVYIADSADDKLPGNSEAVAQRNADLAEKFESAVVENDRLAEQGLGTFKDLETKYPDIFSN